MYAARIQTGIERKGDRWRCIVHMTDPDGEMTEHVGEWTDEATAEAQATTVSQIWRDTATELGLDISPPPAYQQEQPRP